MCLERRLIYKRRGERNFNQKNGKHNMSTQKPSGKGLMLLAVWAVICYCLFPLPVNLIICFIGIIIFDLFITLAEMGRNNITVRQQMPPSDPEPEESKPKPRNRSRPKITVKLDK